MPGFEIWKPWSSAEYDAYNARIRAEEAEAAALRHRRLQIVGAVLRWSAAILAGSFSTLLLLSLVFDKTSAAYRHDVVGLVLVAAWNGSVIACAILAVIRPKQGRGE